MNIYSFERENNNTQTIGVQEEKRLFRIFKILGSISLNEFIEISNAAESLIDYC